MAVKIRMQRHGSKKRPFYFIVAANSTSPRDGKFIEKLGTYNPLTVPATVELDREKALNWLQKGAQPTNTVRRILSFKGVLYMKHLQRGVSLGLFDENAAKEKFDKWIVDHEQFVAEREKAHKAARQEKRASETQESVRKTEEKLAAKKAETEKAEAEAAAAEAEANEEAVAEPTTETEAEAAPETPEAGDDTPQDEAPNA